MSYDYQKERPAIFTDKGQRDLLKVRDQVKLPLEMAGAFQMEKAWKTLGSYDSWYALALVDRLVELGELREIRYDAPGQHRLFVKAHQ